MSDNAYKLGRTMVWSNTAGLYMDSFEAGSGSAWRRLARLVAVAASSAIGRMNRRS